MEKIKEILKILDRSYPAQIALTYSNPFELLVATILSAQSTDKTVNRVTPELFRKFRGPAGFAGAKVREIEKSVSSINFFRNKAKNIHLMSKMLIEHYGGKVPDRMEELVKLPGVARKTANVVLSKGFGKNEGIVVDTHVRRITQRLGLTKNNDPVKIELDLMKIIPKNEWGNFPYRLILHGRQVCAAKTPKCGICPLEKPCPSSLLKK